MSDARIDLLAEEPAPLAAHVRAMETTLSLLHAAGEALAAQPASVADLRPIARALEMATVLVLDAYDARRDPVAALDDAVSALDDATPSARAAIAQVATLAPLDGWIAAARGWIMAARAALGALPAARVVPRDVVVAVGVPRSFLIARGSLSPRFAVAQPLQPAGAPLVRQLVDPTLSGPERIALAKQRAQQQREEAETRRAVRGAQRATARASRLLPDEVTPGFIGARLVAVSSSDFVVRRARELFEEVCAMGLQRTGQLGEMWRDADALDQRMLRAIDALAVLGDRAVRALEEIVMDAPAKDPSLGFGLAMALGAFEGRDALAAIERAARWLDPENVAVRAALGGGLKLAPHPDLAPWLRAWLHGDVPSLRALAIDVLGHRRFATAKDLEHALNDTDARVVAPALRWAALGPEPVRLLARHAIEVHRGSSDPLIVAATCWANVLGGFAAAAEEVESSLDGEHETQALIPFAVRCDLEQARRFLDLVERAPTPARVEALGFIGLGESLDLMIDLLADPSSSTELRQELAFALQRITGHEVFDAVDVPPERLEAEAPPDPKNLPPAKASLAREVSDPRDVPSDGAPDRMKLPTTQSLAWEDYLVREERRYPAALRFRRGQPFTPGVCLAELDRYSLTPRERRILFAELVVGTGACVPLDPHDFVRVQEHAIGQWAPIVNKASSQPGTWGRPRRH